MLTLQRTLAITLLAFGLTSNAFSDAITVTNTNDNGAGSLRQAIIDANADPSFTAIVINIDGNRGSERIINVPTALPAFTSLVTLTTAPGQGGRTVLLAPIINGPGAATTGITFNSGSSGSTVTLITFRSFVFSIVLNAGSENILNNNFENNQGGIDIRLLSGGGNTLQGNIFTTTNTGASAIAGNSTGNSIKGNIFAGTGINLAGNGHTIGGPGVSDGNTFSNAPGTAINLSSSNGAIVQNNTITGSKGTGLVAGGIDIQILSNTFSTNIGWDINIQTGYFVQIFSNNITGDNSTFNGILVQNGLSYEINGNTVNGGSIELQSTSSSFQYGALTVQNNTITNDPTGFSGHGSISLSNVTNAQIDNNNIHNNASNGIYFLTSTNNYVRNNTIYENARTGIYATNNLYNKLSRNVIYNNHDDIYGGKTGIYATAKAIPVITSAVRVGNTFVITGSGSAANDSLEFFLSNRATRNSSLAQNALAYEGAIKATGTTWTATLPANNQNGEFYFIATATDVNNSTSSYSLAVGVQINGPTSTAINQSASYYADYIPGATYSWWSTLPIANQTVSGNQVSFTFNQAGAGTVSVGYTDPTTGAWKQYSLAVNVYSSSRTEENSTINPSALAYPNPFLSTTHVALEGNGNISLKLYDNNGSLVYSSDGHTHGDLVELGNNLKSGIYILKMISDGDTQTTRIVKGQ